jgi:glyoxylase-like metal-dependent hydrolase (beta-lactamase superfamily II)
MSGGATGHPAYGELRPVTAYAAVLLARNPSPMTLDGTNTWLLRAPGAAGAVVVDPGPDDEAHLARVAAAGPVRVILLTHGHPDHAAGARRLHELTGAPVRALDPAHRYGGEGLAEGDVVAAGGVELRVLATPGHTGDSLCFLASGPPGEPTAEVVGGSGSGSAGGPGSGPVSAEAVLTGDTVLGRGSTVVVPPDGRLADYLASLRRLVRLGDRGHPLAALPGHGPELPDVAAMASRYLAHREQRLAEVRAALAELGPGATARQLVEHVYADVDRGLWWAAELSVRAQLDYLAGGQFTAGPGAPAGPAPG